MSSPNAVDGINTVVWTIAAEQARLGHQVGLLVGDPPDEQSVRFAHDAGVEIHYVPASRWSYNRSVGSVFLSEPAVDLVHCHSVFMPRQATLARWLRRRGIPYVVTPHGGLMPEVLDRGRFKKMLYSRLVERDRIHGAAAIAYVTPGGARDIQRFVPSFAGPIQWIPNPVDIDRLQTHDWRPEGGRPQLTFLGRYDVYHKGIDRLAEIARRVPEADFYLYGIEDRKTKRHFNTIKRFGPPNLRINGPVFGLEKLEVLRRSTMYIQVSRWEALSISILEALALGVPSAIAESMSMASMFSDNDLGLVVSTKPTDAACQIRDALARPQQLQAWSDHSREYTQRHFSPPVVAKRIIEVYEEALEWFRYGEGRQIPSANGRYDRAGLGPTTPGSSGNRTRTSIARPATSERPDCNQTRFRG